MKTKAEEFEDWLFSDAAREGDFDTFNDKYMEFYATIRDAETRKKEAARRPKELSEAHSRLDKIETLIGEIQKKRPWVTDEQIKEAMAEVEEHRKWLEDKVVE